MENREYRDAYIAETHNIKKRRVWIGYGVGAGVWLVIVAVFVSSY